MAETIIARRHRLMLPNWVIPFSYAAVAVLAGFTLPRIESRWLPSIDAGMSPVAAIVIYSSIATGMIALTGVVFSLAFVMVQFSAMAYSPRLVLWISRDWVLWHSLGAFTATFLYSLSAIAWLDRNRSGRVPFFSGWMVILLLLASVAMFVALVDRISLLQIQRMLVFTGDRGRLVVERMYPPLETPLALANPAEFEGFPVTQTLLHKGRPRAIQALDKAALMTLSSAAGGIVEVISSAGDSIVEGTLLLRIYGARQLLDERALRKAFDTGEDRTFEQDPKYAIRLLVDIAIRALSSAINDPTTAVQALNQIEDLLVRLGSRRLEIDAIRDSRGTLRIVIPHPRWEDFLSLAFDEIRFYGANSVQVMRRMKALLNDLILALPRERHKALRDHLQALDATIARSFEDAAEKQEASVEDRQGLGVPRRHSDHL